MKPPAVVEVEINNNCNLKCSYCPNSCLPMKEPKQIEPQLFLRILEQLSDMDFAGRFSFHLYSEPLLCKHLNVFVQYVKKYLPKATPVLFTNGTYLSEKRYLSLIDAGIDQFIVTLHDNTSLPNRPFQSLLTKDNLLLTNRGGSLGEIPKPLQKPCYAPMEMLIITCEGEILQCFEDARKRRIIGNIHEKSLKEIWGSKKFCDVREILSEGKRHLIKDLCALCDNQDYHMPGLTKEITCQN